MTVGQGPKNPSSCSIEPPSGESHRLIIITKIVPPKGKGLKLVQVETDSRKPLNKVPL